MNLQNQKERNQLIKHGWILKEISLKSNILVEFWIESWNRGIYRRFEQKVEGNYFNFAVEYVESIGSKCKHKSDGLLICFNNGNQTNFHIG